MLGMIVGIVRPRVLSLTCACAWGFVRAVDLARLLEAEGDQDGGKSRGLARSDARARGAWVKAALARLRVSGDEESLQRDHPQEQTAERFVAARRVTFRAPGPAASKRRLAGRKGSDRETWSRQQGDHGWHRRSVH